MYVEDTPSRPFLQGDESYAAPPFRAITPPPLAGEGQGWGPNGRITAFAGLPGNPLEVCQQPHFIAGRAWWPQTSEVCADPPRSHAHPPPASPFSSLCGEPSRMVTAQSVEKSNYTDIPPNALPRRLEAFRRHEENLLFFSFVPWCLRVFVVFTLRTRMHFTGRRDPIGQSFLPVAQADPQRGRGPVHQYRVQRGLGRPRPFGVGNRGDGHMLTAGDP